MILKRISEKLFGVHRKRHGSVKGVRRSSTSKFAQQRVTALLVNSKLRPKALAATSSTAGSPTASVVSLSSTTALTPVATAVPHSPTSLARLPHPSIRMEYERPLSQWHHRQQHETPHATASRGTASESCSCVTFKSRVTVVEIPSFRDYCADSRKRIWATAKERKETKTRNNREFSADHRDWRKCREDDEFVMLEGQMVHPHTFWRITGERPVHHDVYRKRRENAPESDVKVKLATRRKTLTGARTKAFKKSHNRLLPIAKHTCAQ